MKKDGKIVVTSAIKETLAHSEIAHYLFRHFNDDWGDLEEDDKKLNESALKNNDDQIFSMYKREDGQKIYVITEWDRSATTVLYSHEY